MLTTATTELIHSVLDGEASEAEAQQLQRLLAAEPAARVEFDAAERLFADFKSVPQRHPPEGLVAAVMADVEVPAAKSRAAYQLSSRPRVFGSSARDIAASALPNTARSNRFQSFLRSIDMSQQTRSPFGSRKIWIGSAIAVAPKRSAARAARQGSIAVTLAHYGIEFSALFNRQHGSLHASISGCNTSDFNDSVD